MTPEQLAAWLHARPVRVLDGAMSSELIRRGVTAAARGWGVGALLEAPDEVRRLHRDHALAGAEALTACTFRVAPFSLRRLGLADRAAQLASLAVRLAREGAAEAERECLVLGSQTTLEDCYRPDLAPGDATLEREHAATATLLAEAGADALLLETFGSAREAAAAAAAAAATGLPVLLCLVCRSGGRLLSGEDAATAATDLTGVVALGVNCTAVADVPASLGRLAAASPLPLLAYANNAWFAEDSAFLRAAPLTPEEYAAAAGHWAGLGARLVGGCCGTTPAHVAAIAARLAAPTP